jgi:adenylyl-sulfate kinase
MDSRCSLTGECRVLWFTGLSGSGKTTIAEAVREHLARRQTRVCVLDGDQIRSAEHRHLTFSREDIVANNRLILQKCVEMLQEHDVILVPIISPLACSRAEARQVLGNAFVEVHVDASLETCARRDVKGLYRKAREGVIPDLIGFAPSNPYEPPQRADLVVETETETVQESVERVLAYLRPRAEVR